MEFPEEERQENHPPHPACLFSEENFGTLLKKAVKTLEQPEKPALPSDPELP